MTGFTAAELDELQRQLDQAPPVLRTAEVNQSRLAMWEYWRLGCAARLLGRQAESRAYFALAAPRFWAEQKRRTGPTAFDTLLRFEAVCQCMSGIARRLAGEPEPALPFFALARQQFEQLPPHLCADIRPGGAREHPAYGQISTYWAYVLALAGDWEQASARAAGALASFARATHPFPELLAWAGAIAALAEHQRSPSPPRQAAAQRALAGMVSRDDYQPYQRVKVWGYVWDMQDAFSGCYRPLSAGS